MIGHVLIIKIILLIALLRVLAITEKPILCAGIYSSVALIFGFMSGAALTYIAVTVGISFALSFLYFWLLNRFNHGPLYFVIMILGLGIGLV
ncbi:hypothetical protein [Pseudoalteromonas luteoviolacea]|uniref:Uncharacterized protein n=1 Tax=Pseudoalteromonas luteoviolacea S4054 TaxID=1129367 RepID=A0A0F6AID0_9GAMM|nr:hypothetical protein [Pseudoalteromonas luteoviolacea]AOT08716.1 hypothetical protein S4054249_13015 [Pseudoalteromonas luteoviolacea]AOT13631.1 hypothetical protein S40542_12990 [Pseudoalteromonas luteoviolacea]AOT18544.1 hypothetical protein S4054_12990 [Pseudoalteromonas luteoviolacea]KKE85611.1 hypothetical protein N479_25690 [Pseudoalteromonas luteoviolacea S4054]KZN71979.1 hypothetical protein N481_16340 [Pseudoalteromonas luteoviolacea S4047-1]